MISISYLKKIKIYIYNIMDIENSIKQVKPNLSATTLKKYVGFKKN